LQIKQMDVRSENISTSGNSKTLSASDKVWVLVEMQGATMADYYLDNSVEIDFKDFVLSQLGVEFANTLLETQSQVKSWIDMAGIEATYKYSYTSIMNGFAAEIKYGDIAFIEKLPNVSRVVLSEQYKQTDTISYDDIVSAVNESTGIFKNDTQYQGEGMFIAVIDNGFDYKHSAFSTQLSKVDVKKDDIANIVDKIWGHSNYGMDISADSIYISSKVPFQFDYANRDTDVLGNPTTINYFNSFHGTHVSAIAVGDDEVIKGSAPKAQLAMMKVFADYVGGAQTVDIVAALSDCAILGVDAVNLSLGVAAGFTYERREDLSYVNDMYDRLQRLGILICAAAGNEANASTVTIDHNVSATNPDAGMLGSPSSYPGSFAIASINTVKANLFTVNDSPIFYQCAVNSNSVPFDIEGMILGGEDQRVLEAVVMPGTGIEKDYNGLDVSGKVVLVKRGDSSFEEKQNLAASKGAIACIIYNNVMGMVNPQILGEMKIPTFGIQQLDGMTIIDGAKENHFEITFKKGNSTFLMSDFSSWGPSPDLSLKPDITAPGGNILSAMPDGFNGGKYGRLSGTSMATPNLTGIMTALKQYLSEKFAYLTDIELKNLCFQIIQSTATKALDYSGNYASVRQQGAGVANIDNAIKTNAYISVTGSNRAKLELGDDKNRDGMYTLRFNITNFGDKDLSYKIDTTVMTEQISYDKLSMSQRTKLLDGSQSIISGKTVENNVVTVQAGKTVSVKVVITLTEDEKAYLDEYFVNGIYVEGFAELTAIEEGSVNLSIPFLSFYGDWTKAPIFDTNLYDNVQPEIFSNRLMGYLGSYSTSCPMGAEYEFFILGEGLEAPKPSYDRIALTVDPNGICYIYSAYMATFRNMSYLEYNIYDTITGYKYYTYGEQNLPKTIFNGKDIVITGHELFIDPTMYDWCNNQQLTFSVDAYLDVDGKYAHSKIEFPLYIDYEKPTVKDANLREENGRTLIDVEVYDNHYFSTYLLCTPSEDQTILNLLDDQAFPVNNWKKGEDGSITIDITDYISSLNNGEFYIALADCAYNQSIYYVGNIKQDTVANNNENNIVNEKNDEVTADYMRTLGVDFMNDKYYDLMMSNAIDREIESRELIEYSHKNVIVNDVGEHKFSVNENGTLVGYSGPGGDIVIPDNIGVLSIAGSTDVFRNRMDITSIKVPEGCVTLEAHTFRGCSLKDCTLPSTLKTIGRYSFYNSAITNLTIPEGVTEIPRSMMGLCSSLESISLPSTLQGSVGGAAFSFCKSLKEITLPDGITSIDYDAFVKCGALKKAKLSKNITLIDTFAFAICVSLEEVNFEEMEHIEMIAMSSFAWNISLKKIVIPDSNVEIKINPDAFSFTTALESFICYADIKQINTVFSDNINIKEVKFFGKVGLIAGNNFDNSQKLEILEFHDDIGDIGGNYWAEFSFSMISAKSIHFYGNVGSISGTNFSNCPNLEEVVFHKNLGSISQYPFGASTKLKKFSVSADNEFLVQDPVTGIVYDKNHTTMFAPSSWDYDGILEIPETVTSLTVGQFGVAWRSLQNVTITKEIHESVATALINRTHPELFEEKPLLKGVIINSNITNIPDYAFKGFTNLENVEFKGDIATIGQQAFYMCGIKNLKLPDSVMSIGDYAFSKNNKMETANIGT
ncbi:MAG: leucine-rich repeat protein, partial [Clostridia bacterium]